MGAKLGVEANNKIRNARQEVASWLVMLGTACFGAVALFGVIHGTGPIRT